MDCNEAEKLIMKYLDGDLNVSEAKALNGHIANCCKCREEFYIYDSMLVNLKQLPDFEAPEGFEASVMIKIEQLDDNLLKLTSFERLKEGLWGVFTVFFGAGSMLAYYREPIMQSLSKAPYIGEIVEKVEPITIHMNEFSEGVSLVFEEAFGYIGNFSTGVAGFLLGAIVIMCAVQFYITSHKKSDKKADDK